MQDATNSTLAACAQYNTSKASELRTTLGLSQKAILLYSVCIYLMFSCKFQI